MMKSLFIAVFFCLIALCSANTPVVTIPQGSLQGLSVAGVNVFLGVPYAKPPLGPLRWRPPNDPEPWKGVRNASMFGPSCIQGMPSPSVQSEDCLFVNIFAPANAKGAPVMVWIHGGAFFVGDSNGYPGQVLAQRTGAVIVTLNYRIGIAGFLALPGMQNEPSPFNYGLLDQRAALKWVQANVEYFGGDPTRVTLFGESAGAGSVQWHLLLKESWPLFSAAILQSPGPWRYPTLSKAFELGESIAKACGCTQSDPSEVLQCMRSIGSSQFPPFVPLTLAPVVDGVEITTQPANLWIQGQFRPNTPMIFGSTSEEGNMLVFSATATRQINESSARSVEDSNLMFSWEAERMEVLYSIYNKPSSSGSFFEGASQMIGDTIITCGNNIAVESAAKYSRAPLYRYVFEHATEKWYFSGLGATHGVDLAYVFGVPVFGENFTAAETALSDWVAHAWGNFSASYKPTLSDSVWDRYNPSSATASILGINLELDHKTSWRSDECQKIFELFF